MPRCIGRTAATERRLLQRLSPLLLAAPLAFGVLLPAVPAFAGTTITVTTAADDLTANGNCSLREAIRAANLDHAVDACPAGHGADTITLPAGTYALAIAGDGEDVGLTGDLDITASVMLEGAGASSTIIDGRALDGVFQVLGPSTVVTISRLTIANGSTFGIVDRTGGGLANGSLLGIPGGTVRVVDSVIRDNFGGSGGGGVENNNGAMTLINTTVTGNGTRFFGGGVSNNDRMTIINSTISRNHAASGVGGGILNGRAGRLTVIGSTLSGNTANLAGGGIRNLGTLLLSSSTITASESAGLSGDATIRNTIIARSIPVGSSGPEPDCRDGTLTSEGYNLIENTDCAIMGDLTGNVVGVDPKVGPLQDNGGPTLTHALLPGSPAIDVGNPATPGSGEAACSTTDQRGVARPQDGNGDGRAICDIGAFELQVRADMRAPTTTTSLNPLPNAAGWNRGNVTVSLTAQDEAGGSGVRSITFSASGAQPPARRTVSGSTTSVVITAEGVTTLSYFAKDQAGNQEQSKTMVVKIDETKPLVSFAGDEGTYRVDQGVQITCAATDPRGANGAPGSGIASTTCRDVDGPAYGFSVGANIITAPATDVAGNTGSGVATFTVTVTNDSLCTVSRRLVTSRGIANGMCTVLHGAQRAAERGHPSVKRTLLGVYERLVDAARQSRYLSDEHAAILSRLVRAL
jgi:CSLREA domain-containing protein